MPGYLLIESCDPFESEGAVRTYELAIQLRAAGHEVTLFLVQNAVLAVRASARAGADLSGRCRAGPGNSCRRLLAARARDPGRRLAAGVRPGAARPVIDCSPRREDDLELRRKADMTEAKTLTFVLMDAPFESARTATAMRLLDIAALGAATASTCSPTRARWRSLRASGGACERGARPRRHEENHPLPKIGCSRSWSNGDARRRARLGELRPVRRRARRGRDDRRRARGSPADLLEDGASSPTTRSSSPTK